MRSSEANSVTQRVRAIPVAKPGSSAADLKGANLAEMANLVLPVPPGFTISTEVSRTYLAIARQPQELADEVDQHLAALQTTMGKRLGESDDPLLVSVRSGGARYWRRRFASAVA